MELKDSGGRFVLSPTRIYDKETGRYLSRDPVSNAGAVNASAPGNALGKWQNTPLEDVMGAEPVPGQGPPNPYLYLARNPLSGTDATGLEDQGKRPDQIVGDFKSVKEQLTVHEGKRDKAYKDTKGIPTIGVGFNLKRQDAKKKIEALGKCYADVLEGVQALDDDEVEKLLERDIQASEEAARRHIKNFGELPERAQRVLTDMVFNLGDGRFGQFKKAKDAFEKEDWHRAAAEMVDSEWFKQVGKRGRNDVRLILSLEKEKPVPDELKKAIRGSWEIEK